MAKHYNPFKMWGAWIGAVIGGFLGWFKIIPYFIWNIGNFINSQSIMRLGCSDSCTNSMLIGQIIFSLLIGFLIGWGVQSLIRKLRK